MPRRLGRPLIAALALLASSALLTARPSEEKPGGARRHVETRVAREQDEATLNRAADSAGRERGPFGDLARKDGDLRIVTNSGRAAYACRPPRFARAAAGASVRAADVGTDTSPYVGDAPFPLEQTFALHTRPGAARVLYLDFDGFTVHATDWNDSNRVSDDIAIAPFDVDGDPAVFGDRERADIQEVWRRVAEDFAPFDVDVTTEDPGRDNLLYDGPGDAHWGMRMVCGGRAGDVLGPGNEGVIGVAYLDSYRGGFSLDGDGNPGTDTPAFAFAADIIEGEPEHYAAEIASTASHEFGHTLGLQHDGDSMREYYPGYPGWAPIMGSGDPLGVVQWSKGEYPRANNKEDDLALIAAQLPYIACDHGVDKLGAVALGPRETAGGVILSATDAAWYKVSAAAGAVSFTGSVATPSQPNLKLRLKLLDAAGNVVASSPVGSQMSAALSASLAARGTYYLVVDGAPHLTPSTGFSDYDSIGRFGVTGSWQAQSSPNLPPVAAATASPASGGRAPAAVSFSGTGSFDPDGFIAGYEWDFGDGSPRSSLASPAHSYILPGDYAATLTVTDSDGVAVVTTVSVSVLPPPADAKLVSVASIEAAWGRSKGPRSEPGEAGAMRAKGASVEPVCWVVVRDSLGQPLRNAMVDVGFSGLVSGARTAKTDRTGRATVKLPSVPGNATGSILISVTGVRLVGYYYYPASNQAASVSISR